MLRKLLICAILLMSLAHETTALTITRKFSGGSPGGNNVGTGNLTNIFNAAADFWEQVIQDDYTLVLNYGWAPVGAAQHTLLLQGGTPNRELEGTIRFNNTDTLGQSRYYLDPTPRSSEEYAYLFQAEADFGGGKINAARVFLSPSGAAASFEHLDLFSVALQEIGQALGLCSVNLNFQTECADRDIDVTAPLPYAGSALRVQSNTSGPTSLLEETVYGTLMAGVNPRERRIPSTEDILAVAQLGKFTKVNLQITPRLQTKPSAAGLTISWRELFGPFRLESTGELGNSLAWTGMTQSAISSNDLRSVTLPVSEAKRFFRLACP